MGKQRKTWSAEVKEVIVLSVLRGELSTAEAARQHGVNEGLVHTWKAHFLDADRRAASGGATRQRTSRSGTGERPLEADCGRKGTGAR